MDDEIGFDFKNISKFGKRYKKQIGLVLLLIIPIVLSIFLRIQPAYLPITDDWAERSINNNIKANIEAQIAQQFPNLPEQNRKQIVNEEFAKIVSGGTLDYNGQQIDIQQVIEENSKYLKDKFQNSAGTTYLLAIDPYYYYRHTRNAVTLGHEGEIVDENGRYHDGLILAGRPLGEGFTDNYRSLHVFLQTQMVKIWRMFNPEKDIMGVVFLTPMIIGTLAVIPAFFLARKIGGNIAGLFAGILVALHPAFMTRTAAGFSDTDAYNVFLPLCVVWFLFEALSAKKFRNSMIFAGLAGFFVGLFAWAWGGWFFIMNFTGVLLGSLLVYHAIIHRKDLIKGKIDDNLKNTGLIAAAFGVASFLFVGIFKSFNDFIAPLKGVFFFMQLKDVGTTKVWPNVYTTVAELNPATIKQTITQISLNSEMWYFVALLGLVMPLMFMSKKRESYSIGLMIGSVLWYLGLIFFQNSFKDHVFYSILLMVPVFVWIIFSYLDNNEIDIKYSLILVIWFASTIYASSKGVRFILLLVPAFAVSAGIAIGFIDKKLRDSLSKAISVDKRIITLIVVALFAGLLTVPIVDSNGKRNPGFYQQAYATAVNEVPSMNDDWYAALTKIRDESAPDAIINSWWDFGHWFAAIGERRVTLDGGRQNGPAAHWLGKLMVTWDEDESVGILRYLDCGSNTAFNNLLPLLQNDSLQSIETIYDIINSDKDGAIEILRAKGLSQEEIDSVITYSHCDAPENYFITSEDMVGKSGVWAHFGSWNFTRAVMFNKVHNLNEDKGISVLKDEFGMESDEARSMYYEIKNANADRWIAPWPSYSGLSGCSVSDTTITCQNGIVFDLDTEEATIQTQDGVMRPKAVAYIKDGEFRVKKYNEDVLVFPQTDRPLGVALIPSGNRYTSLLMDGALTASMFTRLFYYENMDGGLRHFEKFHEVTDVTGQKIIVWKINWEGAVVAEPEPVEAPEADETEDSDSFDLAMIEQTFIGTENRTDEEALELLESGAETECSQDLAFCQESWFGRGVMPEEIENTVFAMSVGDESEPIKTEYGYHIIKLIASK